MNVPNIDANKFYVSLFFAKFQSSNKVLCKNDYKNMALEPKHNNTCVFYNYQGKETDLLIAFSVNKWLYYPHSVTKKIRTTLFMLSVSIIIMVLWIRLAVAPFPPSRGGLKNSICHSSPCSVHCISRPPHRQHEGCIC